MSLVNELPNFNLVDSITVSGAEPEIESEKSLHESDLFGEPLDESPDAADRPGDSTMAEEITARPCRTVVHPDTLLPDEEYGSVETADSTVLPKSVRAKTYVETTTKKRGGGQSAEEAEQQKEEDEHQQGHYSHNDDGHHGRVGRK